ncbi:hypothetical protein WAB17_09945 [Parerythrobacter aurantius]|uniref:hypothetical protein n=1 Tax=Parerythrobacter aurantius TaxID=3127706 RepID=UPI00324A4FCF
MTFSDLTPHVILFLAGAIAVLFALVFLGIRKEKGGHAAATAAFGAGFAGLTAVTIWSEGPLGFLPNHTANLWGVQVWYDLLFAVCIALSFIVPRARAAGMNLLPWILFVGLTASIGLLAMAARLYWLEGQASDPGASARN